MLPEGSIHSSILIFLTGMRFRLSMLHPHKKNNRENVYVYVHRYECMKWNTTYQKFQVTVKLCTAVFDYFHTSELCTVWPDDCLRCMWIKKSAYFLSGTHMSQKWGKICIKRSARKHADVEWSTRITAEDFNFHYTYVIN